MICAAWQWPVAFSFGLIKPRAIVVGDKVEVRKTTMLGMTFDPNVMIGAPAARYFNRVVELLESAAIEAEELTPEHDAALTATLSSLHQTPASR